VIDDVMATVLAPTPLGPASAFSDPASPMPLVSGRTATRGRRAPPYGAAAAGGGVVAAGGMACRSRARGCDACRRRHGCLSRRRCNGSCDDRPCERCRGRDEPAAPCRWQPQEQLRRRRKAGPRQVRGVRRAPMLLHRLDIGRRIVCHQFAARLGAPDEAPRKLSIMVLRPRRTLFRLRRSRARGHLRRSH